MNQPEEIRLLKEEVKALRTEVKGLKEFINAMYNILIEEGEEYEDSPLEMFGNSDLGRYNT